MTASRLLTTVVIWAVGTTGMTTTVGGEAAASVSKRPVTEIRSVSPVDANGHLGAKYDVHRRYGAANCQSGSPETGTTYQCFTPRSAQGVYDSCWVQSDPSHVMCLVKPWLHQAVRLHVTRGYDDSAKASRPTKPWGIRLGPDTRCLLDLAAVRSTHGHAITYLCTKNTVLTGRLDRRHPAWRVHAYRRISRKGTPPRYRSLGARPISVIWRAVKSRSDVTATASGSDDSRDS